MLQHRPGHVAIVIISTFMLQLALPASAWADEGNPPPEPAAGETPSEGSPLTEAAVPTVAEILAEAPDATGLLVIDAAGEPQPLATVAAADALADSDPVWCQAGHVPSDDLIGGTYCTPPQTTVGALVSALGADPITYSGVGTIFFTTAYGTDDVYLHGADPRLSALTSLTLDGMDFAFSVPIEVTGWASDVSIVNLIMDLTGYGTPAAGLRVETDGTILVDGVSVTGSGGGAYLDNVGGTGGITVADSSFSTNSWTGLEARTSGSILVHGVVATGDEYGAYLDASAGTGGVSVDNSDFSDSTFGGVTARTAAGDITLDFVTADDSTGAGSYGAGLATTGGGEIRVGGGSFQGSAGRGLWIEASGAVALNSVTASGNDVHGATIHNLGACDAAPLTATIDGGTYQNNTGGYGVLAVLGPAGTFTVSGAPTAGGNGVGDFFADLNPCPVCEEKPEGKPFNVVHVPETGGPPVALDCIAYAGTVLILPDGTRTTLVCPVSESATLESLSAAGLPAPLPTAREFASGLHLSITQGGNPLPVIEGGGYITLAFANPIGLQAASLAVLYWDPSLNSGAGGWVELPAYALLPDGSPMPHRLHPEAMPDDPMRILGGVHLVGQYVKVAVNFPGVFVLATR